MRTNFADHVCGHFLYKTMLRLRHVYLSLGANKSHLHFSLRLAAADDRHMTQTAPERVAALDVVVKRARLFQLANVGQQRLHLSRVNPAKEAVGGAEARVLDPGPGVVGVTADHGVG